jgi:gluconate:H+ symporter, GntP family
MVPYPILILIIGIVVVVGMIVVLRINAFIALITAAIIVSLMAPGPWALKIERVASSFGSTAASIGIVIALAAVIGKAMMDSGAADRIVRMFLQILGEERSSLALLGSGFTLSIPVFFDTAFYLLVPLARSLYRQTNKHYLRYLIAIAAGGALTHTLVPPTPGPLFIANQLGVDLGMMIGMGLVVAAPSALVGLYLAGWFDKRMPIAMRPYPGDEHDELTQPADAPKLPNLALSLAPILLPILLITGNSVVKVIGHGQLEKDPAVLVGSPAERFVHDGKLAVMTTDKSGAVHAQALSDSDITDALLVAAEKGMPIGTAFQVTNLVGNPNFALLISAFIAVTTLWWVRRPTRQQMSEAIEEAMMSGGVIILITAAGGAFGGMLKAAQLADAIKNMFGATATSGLMLLPFAFGIASLIKFAQGSSTAAMIVTSGMIAAMVSPQSLGYHPVYLALAIGSGSLVGSWMNDSGFWIFAKMGVLTEVEALKTWTITLIILGLTSGLITLLLAAVMPMAG